MYSSDFLYRFLWFLFFLLSFLIGHPLSADEPFDYFTNSWNVIGLDRKSVV